MENKGELGGCDSRREGGMKPKGQKRTWKKEEEGRDAKWMEHKLEVADERVEKKNVRENEIDIKTLCYFCLAGNIFLYRLNCLLL